MSRPDTTRQDSCPDASPFRALPSVRELIESPALAVHVAGISHQRLVAAARSALAETRDKLSRTGAAANSQDAAARTQALKHLVERVAALLARSPGPALPPVINATGILLHTGLGRAPLAARAVDALTAAAANYTPVELDLDRGERGERSSIVRSMLCELTGAESALVVNNNAAGLLLALCTLAHGRRVIVSRGELIEIGGSFRLPEIMAASGAILHEVGTTNRSHLSDYAGAIDASTAAILKVHPSNYVVRGFTSSVPLDELAGLAAQHGLPLLHDVGSGAIIDFGRFGLPAEPVVRKSIADGADLVLFSGDKLLGGPQAGIIAGRQELIQRIARHPIARAVRVDKLTLAALAATLEYYFKDPMALDGLPLLAMLRASVESLEARAARLVEGLRDVAGLKAQSVATASYVGGGSMPDEQLPSVALQIRAPRVGEEELAHRLRVGRPHVLPRLAAGAVLADLRTVFPRQDGELLAAVRAAAEPAWSPGD